MAFHGYNTTLELGDAASPEVFSAIAGVQSITPPTLSRASIDVTPLNATGAHRQRISGSQDTGPITATIFYEPDEATHMNSGSGLLALKDSGAIRNWQITLSDAASNVLGPFAAFVSSFQFNEVAMDGAVTAQLELTVTAEPTLP